MKMIKAALWATLCLILCTAFCLDTFADNGSTVADLLKALGLQTRPKDQETRLRDLDVNMILFTKVIDSSKAGWFDRGEVVEIKYLGGDNFRATGLVSGNRFELTASDENDSLKIQKSGHNRPHINHLPFLVKSLPHFPEVSALGFNLSYADYADESYQDNGRTIDTKFNNNLMLEFNYSLILSKLASIEINWNYIQTPVTFCTNSSSCGQGYLRQFPISLLGRFNLPLYSDVILYAGGGVAYFINNFKQDVESMEAHFGPGINADIDNNIGVTARCGMELFSVHNLAISIDAKYFWNPTKTRINLAGYDDQDLDIHMLVLGLGLKFYFYNRPTEM